MDLRDPSEWPAGQDGPIDLPLGERVLVLVYLSEAPQDDLTPVATIVGTEDHARCERANAPPITDVSKIMDLAENGH